MKAEIKISSNKSKRQFTIIKNGLKYQTEPQTKTEFENMEYWTPGDWNDYLKREQDYKRIK